jgi:formate dehydrogenase major subunit
MRRSREEPLAPATWDEALDFAAERLAGIRERHGPDAIGLIACARSTNENNYAAMKFARAGVGTNNIDHCART